MADLVEVRLHNVDGVLEMLSQLPAEVVSKRGGIARIAARKGIAVIQRQARVNWDVAVAQPGASGVTQSTGFTSKQIIIKRKAPRGGANGERFILTVSGKAHPSGGAYRRKSRRAVDSKRRQRARKAAKTVLANDVAFFMEWGTSRQPAIPWLRPAFLTKAEEAIRVTEGELLRQIDRVARAST